MEIIVPAAGLSTRFAGMRPKYLLYDYKNDIMLLNAIRPYIEKHKITIGILEEHDNEFHSRKYIEHEFGNKINVVVLKNRTKGPADTVYQILMNTDCSLNTPILIKDCDSFLIMKIEMVITFVRLLFQIMKSLKNFPLKASLLKTNKE